MRINDEPVSRREFLEQIEDLRLNRDASAVSCGSSAMIRRGAQASAMAIMTRWRMPPEYLVRIRSRAGFAASAIRTRPISRSRPRRLSPRTCPVHVDRLRYLEADGQCRIE